MGKRVMVVDDSRIVQIQMEKILSDTDFEIVACCGSGEEALKKYEEYMPDVVTMDIIMPGMDGLETARLLLQEHPEARILMVSSLAYDDTIDEAREIGAKGFVYKPFHQEDVLNSLEQAVGD
ncbi:MAG: response regulator [Agathobaculum sp.]|uniref:response regulator n=3 Tax=Agathobaculum sp. TaxID=2048138 RepID=UPI0025BF4099|nr:response regulator [Agathobaculum sp.]MCI7124586.1 response regulator [Agathobaculum sp.]